MGFDAEERLSQKQLDIIGAGLEGHDFKSIAEIKEKENIKRYLDPLTHEEAKEFLNKLAPKPKKNG